MHLPKVILASVSPRRRELLRSLEIDFEVAPSDAEEAHHEPLTVREISQLNAYRKARAVAKKHPDALVLGADTLVHLDGRLLGKPANAGEAAEMLSYLQGKTHEVVTGVCLLQLREHRQRLFAETTFVTFHPMTAAEIERYLFLVNTLDKAGAYAIQEQGELIVREIAGSFSNVVGLPVERLRAELARWGASEP